MSIAGIVVSIVGLLWVLGGAVWLLRNRGYQRHQIPSFFVDLIGFPVEIAQRWFGRGGVPYAFLLPNIAIFGFFTFLPMLLNFYVSLTGGESISLLQRPWVGFEKYADIFNCETIFKPRTCTNAGYNFWTGMFNSFWFVVLQVPILCVVALMTALVVNKDIKGRGFWRAMFFYPVMLSPVVIANIWNWVLHRKGALNEVIGGGRDQLTALATITGFDMIATVLIAIILMVVTLRALRVETPETAPLWTLVFGAFFVLLWVWARPESLLGFPKSGAGEVGGLLALGCGFGLAAVLIYTSLTGRRESRLLFGAMAALAVGLLLMIQFDAVFSFERYRPVNWLVLPNTGWPFFWLIFVFTWSHMGFYMLILLAGLQAIPSDLYEAAKMDATKPIRAFWRITLPLVMPTLTVVLVLSLIRGFQIFDEVYLLTGGGPGRETYMVVQNIYETAFSTNTPDYGQAAAGSILMALVIAGFTFAQLWLTRRQSQF